MKHICFVMETSFEKQKNYIETIVSCHILLPMELHLKNICCLYSACSNPTNVVLVIVLSVIIGKGAWYWER